MNSRLPLAIEIEINSHCNLSCTYCPNADFERIEKGFMSPTQYEHIMKDLQKNNYSGRISYHFYNEPTLSPHLNDFVLMTKKYLPNAKAILFTNGLDLDAEKINQLSASGLDSFIITEQMKTNLANIDEASLEVSEDVKSKIKKKSFKKLYFTNRGGILENVGKKMILPLTIPCFIPRSVMVITVKGNVIPCYEDFFQKHVMGNVFEKNITTIWTSEKYVTFRNELKKGNRALFEVCRDCNNSLILV